MNESNQEAIEGAVRTILRAIGEDPDREGLVDTPTRVARAYAEMCEGYSQDPKTILEKTFQSDEYDEIVALRDISFWSMCEHHMLPFHGKAHVAYIPGAKVVGLSKMARLVQVYARRLQIQERLTKQIANAMMDQLDAKGAAVIIEAQHTCMTARGAKQPFSTMVTSTMLGRFRENPITRQEVLSILDSK